MGLLRRKRWNTHLQGCVPEGGPAELSQRAFSPANQLEPTPGLEPGTTSLRVKRVYLADFAICLQMPESRQTTKSVEVRRSPQRSSDVFQRCSNRSASRSAIGSTSRSAAGAGF